MAEWRRLKFKRPELKFRRRESIEFFDTIRKRWIVLTPEEWVRQHIIEWLKDSGIEQQRVILEYPVELNGQPLRADIVVVGQDTLPKLIVECKAPEVEINQAVLDQVVRYNYILKAEYIMLTNGLKSYLYSFDGEKYHPTKSLHSL